MGEQSGRHGDEKIKKNQGENTGESRNSPWAVGRNGYGEAVPCNRN